MSDACFLCDCVDVPVGERLRLDGPEGRHAAAVRRVRTGESLLIADGAGRAVRGPVRLVGDGFVEIEVAQQLVEPAKAHRWVLVQALAKGGRDELALETATELGVDEVIAWQAARSVVRWENKADKGLAKWVRVACEATKQSRRFKVPALSYATTSDVVARIAAAGQAFVLHEAAPKYLSAAKLIPGGEVLFVVGPEGGITDDERELFQAGGADVVLVADHVLRTSTAGLVALAQAQLLAARGAS